MLSLLRACDAGELQVQTNSDYSLKAILGYWLVPLWTGRNALDGLYNEGGMCYHGDSLPAPPELLRLFEMAAELLRTHKLIRKPGDASRFTSFGFRYRTRAGTLVRTRVGRNRGFEFVETGKSEVHDSAAEVKVAAERGQRRDGLLLHPVTLF